MSDHTIRRSIVVGVPPARAFAVWTRRVDLWWPPSHRAKSGALGTMCFEEHVGGRLFERDETGEDRDYGRVTTWEPPSLLEYEFYPGTGRALPTDVSIHFVGVPEGTRVDVVHSAGVAGAAYAASVSGYRRAWDELFESFDHYIRQGADP